LLRIRLELRTAQAQLAEARRRDDQQLIYGCEQAVQHYLKVAWVWQGNVEIERKQRAQHPNLSVPAFS